MSANTEKSNKTHYARLGHATQNLIPKFLQELLAFLEKPTDIETRCKSKVKFYRQLRVDEKRKIGTAASNGNYEDFDISLIYTIIRNLHGPAFSPTRGWDQPIDPQHNEITLGDDVERCRRTRNQISRRGNTSVSDQELNDFFDTFRGIADRLQTALKKTNNEFVSQVDDLKTCCMDEETEKQYLQEIQELRLCIEQQTETMRRYEEERIENQKEILKLQEQLRAERNEGRNTNEQQNERTDNRNRNQGSGWARDGQNDQKDSTSVEWGRHGHRTSDLTDDNIVEHPEFVFFWQKHSPFSQWHESEFTVGDNTFSCAEQFMMFKKAELFEDTWVCQKVLETYDPREHKRLGRQVQNFDQELWDDYCFEIVKEGNFAKFTQNERLKRELLSTGNKTLVEASPYDKIWGIGLEADDERAWNKDTRKGQNLLGYALTEVREQIKVLETKEDTRSNDKPIKELEVEEDLNKMDDMVKEINNPNDSTNIMDTTYSTISNDENNTESNSNSSANTAMSVLSMTHEQSGDNGKDPLVPQNENGGNSADISNQVTNESLPESNCCELQTNRAEVINASNPLCPLEDTNNKESHGTNGDSKDTTELTSSNRESMESKEECISKSTAHDCADETIQHDIPPCMNNDDGKVNETNQLSREMELQPMDTTAFANERTPSDVALTQTQDGKN